MDLVIFKRTANQQGNSMGLTVPPELIEYLDLKIGDEISMAAEKGKYGKYLAIWNSNKQKKK